MHDVTPAVPPAHSFAWDVVAALRQLGGSGGIDEVNERVVVLRGLSEEQQSIPRGQGRTEVEYRLAWARTLAKALGLVENSARGVWSLSAEGWKVTAEEVEERKRLRRQERSAARRGGRLMVSRADTDDGAGIGVDGSTGTDAESPGEEPEGDLSDLPDPDTADDALRPASAGDGGQVVSDWRSHLLEVLKAMDPSAFERLCQRLLREAGFSNVTVTGGSRDGGIDGTGVYRVSLISFPVFFQAKRYANTVSSSVVRDFRGAMAGRGDKGLLITTGTFTADARAEATRDGAPPVDLVDGDALADLLREYTLGVTTTVRTVHDVRVEDRFFTEL